MKMTGKMIGWVSAGLCIFASVWCFVLSFTIGQGSVATALVFLGFLWLIPTGINLSFCLEKD